MGPVPRSLKPWEKVSRRSLKPEVFHWKFRGVHTGIADAVGSTLGHGLLR